MVPCPSAKGYPPCPPHQALHSAVWRLSECLQVTLHWSCPWTPSSHHGTCQTLAYLVSLLWFFTWMPPGFTSYLPQYHFLGHPLPWAPASMGTSFPEAPTPWAPTSPGTTSLVPCLQSITRLGLHLALPFPRFFPLPFYLFNSHLCLMWSRLFSHSGLESSHFPTNTHCPNELHVEVKHAFLFCFVLVATTFSRKMSGDKSTS